jgi:hypothetical protein
MTFPIHHTAKPSQIAIPFHWQLKTDVAVNNSTKDSVDTYKEFKVTEPIIDNMA